MYFGINCVFGVLIKVLDQKSLPYAFCLGVTFQGQNQVHWGYKGATVQ